MATKVVNEPVKNRIGRVNLCHLHKQDRMIDAVESFAEVKRDFSTTLISGVD